MKFIVDDGGITQCISLFEYGDVVKFKDNVCLVVYSAYTDCHKMLVSLTDPSQTWSFNATATFLGKLRLEK